MLEASEVSLSELFSTGQIRLAELSVYNWGSFHGLHSAKIDPEGTLITGDNGAGKSTLIDGLMPLLLPSSKASFNIAAAQGDRTDRTLMSYVRGNYGKAHDGSETATLLKRSGATATGLRALYQADDGSKITLAALFWITQASNSLNDLKRLFVVGTGGSPVVVRPCSGGLGSQVMVTRRRMRSTGRYSRATTTRSGWPPTRGNSSRMLNLLSWWVGWLTHSRLYR